jgi:hypothetical protein
MRRIAVYAALLVLLGLGTSVGTAWLAAGLPVLALGAWSATPDPSAEGVYVIARGWPWPCLAYTWRGSREGHAFPLADEGPVSGPPIRPLVAGQTRTYALPVRPVWGMLIASTVFWALIWFIPVSVWRARSDLRKMRRRLRGRCTRCGYDRQGTSSDTCPECGWSSGRRRHRISGGRLLAVGVMTVLVLTANAVLAGVLIGSFEEPDELHLASCRGEFDMVRALVEGGADVNARSRGEVPLTCAAAHGHTGVISALLDAGADPDATNADGISVLSIAALNDRVEAIELLLANGARTGGENVLQWADRKLSISPDSETQLKLQSIKLHVEEASQAASVDVNPG